MPLWRIFSHPQTFTLDQRSALAKKVTDLYMSRGLPAFYVNVIFIDVDEKATFIGGEPRSNFVRIAVEQIARTMASPDTEQGQKQRTAWMDMINDTLKSSIIDRKELDWELHIYETPRDLWRVQGMDPPPAFSDAEKEWTEKNKPVPYL
ncbi:hypothetical protein RBB50_005990 [Rhinocladiella similis]